MKNFFGLVLICLFAFRAQAQYKRKPKNPFPTAPRFQQGGWFFGPGFSYNISAIGTKDNILPTTGFNQQITSTGKLGYALEGGRYRITHNIYFLNHVDYGLAITQLRGSQQNQVTGNLPSGQPLQIGSQENTFSDHQAGIFFNLNQISPIKQNIFIQNSLGFSGDYFFIQNRAINDLAGGVLPASLRANLNYKFGVGIVYSKNLMIIPSIQTQILQLYSFQPITTGLTYFQSFYKPIVFSLRFLFLNETKPKKCPPVDAIDIPEGYEQQQ